MLKINYRTEIRKKRLAEKNMGFWPFSKWFDGMTDAQVGEDYMRRFFDSPLGETKKITYETYVATLKASKGSTIVDSQIAGLGLGIRLADMSSSTVQDAADNLSEISNGMTPASVKDFTQALTGEATATPFTDAVLNNPLVQLATKVGDSLISVADSAAGSVSFLASVNKYLPFILPVGVGFVVYQVYLKPFVLKK